MPVAAGSIAAIPSTTARSKMCRERLARLMLPASLVISASWAQSGSRIFVRYIVNDAEEGVAFYRDHLGFGVKMNPGPQFAALSRGDLHLFLNKPGAGSAGKAGGEPKPGGWSRFQIETNDLDEWVAELEKAGLSFRGGIAEGKGGRQILLEDPSGNLVELFEPAQ